MTPSVTLIIYNFVLIDVQKVLFAKSDNFGLKVIKIMKFKDITHIIHIALNVYYNNSGEIVTTRAERNVPVPEDTKTITLGVSSLNFIYISHLSLAC
jgi:hypothetical protein